MFCRKCGKSIPDDSVFCPYCGETVKISELTESAEIEEPAKPETEPLEQEVKKQPENESYPYGSCGECGGPLEQDDKNRICENCLFCLEYEEDKANEEVPLQGGEFYVPGKINPAEVPKQKHVVLIAVFACIGLLMVIGIVSGISQSMPTAGNETVSSSAGSSTVQSSAPLSVRQQSILSAYDSAIKSAVEDTIKEKLKHPDTAVITHDTSLLTVNNAIFTDRGSVSYTNAKGESVKEDFTVSVIATDKVYYSLYMKLGKTVFEDDLKGVNSLGIATAYGKQIFNIPDGNPIFKDSDGTIILITDDERQKMSMAEYSKIETGMTYAQVTEIVGSYGEEQARTNVSDYETVILAWEGTGSIGSNANVTFQNGKVIAKAQVGLQ